MLCLDTPLLKFLQMLLVSFQTPFILALGFEPQTTFGREQEGLGDLGKLMFQSIPRLIAPLFSRQVPTRWLNAKCGRRWRLFSGHFG